MSDKGNRKIPKQRERSQNELYQLAKFRLSTTMDFPSYSKADRRTDERIVAEFRSRKK